MTEPTDRQHVYVGPTQHKKLVLKKATIYAKPAGRKDSIQQILEWLVDNHLDDYPME